MTLMPCDNRFNVPARVFCMLSDFLDVICSRNAVFPLFGG